MGKIRKNVINSSSAELAQRVVKVQLDPESFYSIINFFYIIWMYINGLDLPFHLEAYSHILF